METVRDPDGETTKETPSTPSEPEPPKELTEVEKFNINLKNFELRGDAPKLSEEEEA